MTVTTADGTMVPTRDGWIACPRCGQDKILRIDPDTRARALPVYCRRCRHETKLNIQPSQSQEPEPN